MKDAKNKGQSGAQPPAPEWGSLGAWEGGAASILRGPSGLTAPRAPHPAFTILLVIGLQFFFLTGMAIGICGLPAAGDQLSPFRAFCIACARGKGTVTPAQIPAFLRCRERSS